MATLGMKTVAIASGLAAAAVAGAVTLFNAADAPEQPADVRVAENAAAPAAASASAPGLSGEHAAAAGETEREAIADAAENALSQTAAVGASDDATDDETDDETGAEAPPVIEFARGSMDDLRSAGLTRLIEKIESVAGVAEETKVWMATAEIASAAGEETVFQLKGPLTCGRLGCDIAVTGGGRILLETVGETVSAPQIDTLIINAGADTAVTWVFNGEEFVESE